MKVMGIALKTPSVASLAATAVVALLSCGVAAALIYGGGMSVNNGVSIVTGVIGGALANDYGVSVKAHGWRGAVLCAVFSLSLMGLVRFLMWQNG